MLGVATIDRVIQKKREYKHWSLIKGQYLGRQSAATCGGIIKIVHRLDFLYLIAGWF